MARRHLGLVGLLVVLFAGCVVETPIADRTPSATLPLATAPADRLTASLVPWSAQTPAPIATDPLSAAPGADLVACANHELQLGGAGWEGAGGMLAGGFVIWNAGTVPCTLIGRPRVTIVDEAGRPLDVVDRPTSDVDQAVILRPDQEAPVLHQELAGGIGSVRLFWSNWCGRAPAAPLGLVVQIAGNRIRLPVESGRSMPRCDAPDQKSEMSVGPYELSAGPEPTEPSPLPIEKFELTLVVPEQAVVGQVLHYGVILRNPTPEAIDLSPCPVFMERLNTQGGPVVAEDVLACTDLSTIPAGGSVGFAMELPVPAGLPADPDAALVWSLDPFHDRGLPPRPPEGKVGIAVVSP